MPVERSKTQCDFCRRHYFSYNIYKAGESLVCIRCVETVLEIGNCGICFVCGSAIHTEAVIRNYRTVQKYWFEQIVNVVLAGIHLHFKCCSCHESRL